MPDETGPGSWRTVAAFARSDAKVLWRMKTPVVFMFALPALLSLLLGPAVSGDSGDPPGQSVVRFAVMFSFMTVNYVGLALFREFQGGTWLRQAVHRPPRWAFLLGRILPVAGAGLLQLGLFGLAAKLLFHLPLHGNALPMLLVGLALVSCGSVAGVLLYNVSSSMAVFQSITFMLLIAMGGAGGTIVRSNRLPGISRLLGPLTPDYWAMRALSAGTTHPGAWTVSLQSFGVLAAMSAVLAILAYRTFDFRREKSVLP